MIILSCGTGTPKLLVGLEKVFKEEELNIIVNTAEWEGNVYSRDCDVGLGDMDTAWAQ